MNIPSKRFHIEVVDGYFWFLTIRCTVWLQLTQPITITFSCSSLAEFRCTSSELCSCSLPLVGSDVIIDHGRTNWKVSGSSRAKFGCMKIWMGKISRYWLKDTKNKLIDTSIGCERSRLRSSNNPDVRAGNKLPKLQYFCSGACY